MHFTAAVTAAMAGLAAAAPSALVSRQSFPTYTQDQLLNFYLSFEHLQVALYREGIANYTAAQFAAQNYTDTYYRHLAPTYQQDQGHVTFLTNTLKSLGKPAVAECKYRFNATDPHSFVTLSSIIETFTTPGYIGSFAILDNKTLAVDAAAILGDQSRHSTWMRSWSKRNPFVTALDTVLYPNTVWTMLQPYIVSCPSSNPSLPFVPFGPLGVDSNKPVDPKSIVQVNTNVTLKPGEHMYGCWINVDVGCIIVNATRNSCGYTLPVPANGTIGQSYVVLSKQTTNIYDNAIVAGPAIFEVTDPVGYA